jgi:hypothetical protein
VPSFFPDAILGVKTDNNNSHSGADPVSGTPPAAPSRAEGGKPEKRQPRRARRKMENAGHGGCEEKQGRKALPTAVTAKDGNLLTTTGAMKGEERIRHASESRYPARRWRNRQAF